MPTGACHCGGVRVTVPRRPRSVTDCNCSICRRTGALWAYYKASTVKVEAAPGATHGYKWGSKSLEFVRCRKCGCLVLWRAARPGPDSKMGVNWRNFPQKLVASTRVHKFDGAASGGKSW